MISFSKWNTRIAEEVCHSLDKYFDGVNYWTCNEDEILFYWNLMEPQDKPYFLCKSFSLYEFHTMPINDMVSEIYNYLWSLLCPNENIL